MRITPFDIKILEHETHHIKLGEFGWFEVELWINLSTMKKEYVVTDNNKRGCKYHFKTIEEVVDLINPSYEQLENVIADVTSMDDD